ncbi:MAG TPA: glycosyltransferase family 1 protein [Puia sp.]|nr:glycosyltransferase family 1 protein [Puia sp.]
MTIAFIFRKPHRTFFSIERVFYSIIADMKRTGMRTEKCYVPRSGPAPANFRTAIGRFGGKKADIYHITGDIHYTALVLPRDRTVLTIHDCVFLYHTQGIKRWILKQLYLDRPVSRCRMVTTISEATKKDIVRFTGCNPDKIKVIPNPVRENIRFVEQPFQRHKPRILFVGVTPNKNLHRAIKALAGLACHLRIVGIAPPDAVTALQEQKIEHSIVSGLTDDEMAAEYVKADILLFPSLYEGFGLPVVEAQKTGRVVVTSNRSPMKEVAGEGACLVDPESVEAIRAGVTKVTEDEAYRQGLIAAGFKNAERFDTRAITGQYLACYRELLNGSRHL